MERAIDNLCVAQIGLIVKDIEKSKVKFAEFFNMPVPPTLHSGEYAVTKTEYRDNAAPEAACYMAFFNFDNIQIELIEPNEAPSAWREFLENNGEGLHHIAFKVNGMDLKIDMCKEQGINVLQKGEYRKGNGKYAFFDTSDSLNMVVEMLESYE